jgi:formylglycine-generating enzyme required for sulfatase activity
MEANIKPPKVFISYAWEDDIKAWVLDFATRLRSDGVNAILDQWETVPGDQLTEFMEKSVRESDFVVFVCTPTYKRKSNRRKGGVGYEGSIITGEVFAKNNHRKFIPVLRKGKWASAAPSWATAKLFIDLRNDPYNEICYQQLLNTLFGKSPTAPPVWDDTLREKAKREAEEKDSREKEPQEAAEKAVREAELEIDVKSIRGKIIRLLVAYSERKKAEHEAEASARQKAAKENFEHEILAVRKKIENETNIQGFDQIKLKLTALLSQELADAFRDDLIDLRIQVESKRLGLYLEELLRSEDFGDLDNSSKLIERINQEISELPEVIQNTRQIKAVLRKSAVISTRIEYKQFRRCIGDLIKIRKFLDVADLLQTKKLEYESDLPRFMVTELYSYARQEIRTEIKEKLKDLEYDYAIELSQRLSELSTEDKAYHSSLLRQRSNELEKWIAQFKKALEKNNLVHAEILLSEARKIAGNEVNNPKLIECDRNLEESKNKKSSRSPKGKSLIRLGTVIGIVIVLLWLGSLVVPPSSPPVNPTEAGMAASLPIEITDVKDVPMLIIRSGEFIMGSENSPDEKPVHRVHVDTFYIDKYEVTNTLYEVCVRDEACTEPKVTRYYNAPFYKNYPVVFVDWNMADAYCKWRGNGTRLPTEAEWEKAARWDPTHNRGLVYPWGDEVDETKANYNHNYEAMTIFTSFSNGVSPYGVYNMAGNVMEWVYDWYDFYPEGDPYGSPAFGQKVRVARGGAWNLGETYIRSTDRTWRDPNFYGNNLGFRCARDASP